MKHDTRKINIYESYKLENYEKPDVSETDLDQMVRNAFSVMAKVR